VLTDEPKSLVAVRRSVPIEVDTAIRRALQKLPADRFASAAAFASALAAGVTLASAAAATPRPGRTSEAPPRRRVATLAMIGALVCTGLGWALARVTGGAPAERRPVRFTIELDSSILLDFGDHDGRAAIQPDLLEHIVAVERNPLTVRREKRPGRLRILGSGMGARYVDGDLLYLNFRGLQGELFRQPFDLDRLAFAGDAEQLAAGTAPVVPFGRFGFDVSGTGSFVALVGRRRFGAEKRILTVVDRTGRIEREIPRVPPGSRASHPMGDELPMARTRPGRDSADVWITDLASGTTQRLTTDGNDNNDPVWSPDGQQIAYDKLAQGGKDIYLQPLDGGSARRVAARLGGQFPTDWLPDGSGLLVVDFSDAGTDVAIQPLDGSALRPIAKTSANETAGRVSPNGRWIAYQSDETGRDEVYVESYPTPGRRTLVSVAGGVNPVWGRDGHDLFYWKVDQLIAARVESPTFVGPLVVRSRTPLFRAPYVENILAAYDVSPDGRRFVMVSGEERPGRLVVGIDALGRHGPAASH
jgi:Tol biopolymer transport system component